MVNGNLARKRALNEELRMMNEEWQRNSGGRINMPL